MVREGAVKRWKRQALSGNWTSVYLKSLDINTRACNKTYLLEACNKTYLLEACNKTYLLEACNKTYLLEACNKTYLLEACNKTYLWLPTGYTVLGP